MSGVCRSNSYCLGQERVHYRSVVCLEVQRLVVMQEALEHGQILLSLELWRPGEAEADVEQEQEERNMARHVSVHRSC